MRHEGSVFEGRTLDDAVRKGLEALGRSRAEVMITILEEGSGGFLGLGARPYKVRIMPRPGGAFRETEREREGAGGRGAGRGGRGGRGRGDEGPGRGREGRGRGEPVVARGERPERGRRGSGAEGARRPAGEGGAGPRREWGGEGRRDERRREARPMRGAPAAPAAERAPRRERGPESDEAAIESGLERPPGGAPRADAAGAPPDRRRRRRGRRGRGSGGERPDRGALEPAPRVEPRAEAAGIESEGFEPEMERAGRPFEPAPAGERQGASREPLTGVTATAEEGPGMSAEELAATGKRLTDELLRAMGFEATVTAAAQEDHVDVAASVASDEELLTGRKGEVRQALQHLLNRMLNRGEGSRYHLQLEINEFWKRREDELRDLARRLAEEALAGQCEAVTEYLNAQERRIVHVTLKEDARVKTYALGTGLIKRVAVAPADFPEGPRSD